MAKFIQEESCTCVECSAKRYRRMTFAGINDSIKIALRKYETPALQEKEKPMLYTLNTEQKKNLDPDTQALLELGVIGAELGIRSTGLVVEFIMSTMRPELAAWAKTRIDEIKAEAKAQRDADECDD